MRGSRSANFEVVFRPSGASTIILGRVDFDPQKHLDSGAPEEAQCRCKGSGLDFTGLYA